jgi:predicted RNA-binding Zn-ribbon protein involved in translation (DUF1610 family)
MTTIKATCPGCGEVELTAPDITLAVCPTSPLAYYSFLCPSCAETVRKDADDHIVSLLMSGGVDPIVWDIPAEYLERHDGGPALSYDDLLDFALWLGMGDELARLAALPVNR